MHHEILRKPLRAEVLEKNTRITNVEVCNAAIFGGNARRARAV
jgi:hypothetical protein